MTKRKTTNLYSETEVTEARRYLGLRGAFTAADVENARDTMCSNPFLDWIGRREVWKKARILLNEPQVP